MLQRVVLVRQRDATWRPARKGENLDRATPFMEWLNTREPQKIVKADTEKLDGIALEQLVDMVARDGNAELARAVRTAAAGQRIPAAGVAERYAQFRGALDELRGGASKLSAEALATQADELAKLAKQLLDDLAHKAIVGATVYGGVEGMRDAMVPILVVGRGALERARDALSAPEAGSEAREQALRHLAGIGVMSDRNAGRLLKGVRHFRSQVATANVPRGGQWSAGKLSERVPMEPVSSEPVSSEPVSSEPSASKPAPSARARRSQDAKVLAALSQQNLARLRSEVAPLLEGDDGERWQRLLERLKGLQYRIKHATPAFRAIANAGRAASLTGLVRRGAKHKASGMSSAHNTTQLGNADFVFFRFEVGGAPMATRYGPTTMVFDPKLLERHGGWVSLHDQLAPLDRPATRQYDDPSGGDQPLRTTRYPEEQGYKPGQRVSWVHEYPATKQTHTTSFLDEVFAGADIVEGLALSILREVGRIGGGFADGLLGLDPGADPKQVESALAPVVKALVRPEAKVPASVPISEALHVHDPGGDGRYYPDGSVHPEGMAAATVADEAADQRQQIETFADGYQRVSGRKDAKQEAVEKERAKVVSAYKRLLSHAADAVVAAARFATATEGELAKERDVPASDLVQQHATALTVLENRKKQLARWQREAETWGVTGDAEREQKGPKPTKEESALVEHEPQPRLDMRNGLEMGRLVSAAELRVSGEPGHASGANNLCLLNTLVQLAQRQGAPHNLDAQRLREWLQQVLNAHGAAGRAALARLGDEEMLDIYGAEGNEVLQNVMANYHFRIQVLQRAGSAVLAHPVLGHDGPVHYIVHSGNHFEPFWPHDVAQ